MPRRQGACRTTCCAAAGCRAGSASALGCRVDQHPRRGDGRTGAAPTRSAELAFYLIPRTRLLLCTAAISFRHATLRDARAQWRTGCRVAGAARSSGESSGTGPFSNSLQPNRGRRLPPSLCPATYAGAFVCLRGAVTHNVSGAAPCRAKLCRCHWRPSVQLRVALIGQPRCIRGRMPRAHGNCSAHVVHTWDSRRSCDLQLDPCCGLLMPAKTCHAAMPVVKCDMPRLDPPASHEVSGL